MKETPTWPTDAGSRTPKADFFDAGPPRATRVCLVLDLPLLLMPLRIQIALPQLYSNHKKRHRARIPLSALHT